MARLPTPEQLSSEYILHDENGYFFLAIRRSPSGKSRRAGLLAALVHCDRGSIAVVDERLVHIINGIKHFYEASWLIERASSPPAGLRLQFLCHGS